MHKFQVSVVGQLPVPFSLTPLDLAISDAAAVELAQALALAGGTVNSSGNEELDVPEQIKQKVDFWFIHTTVNENVTVQAKLTGNGGVIPAQHIATGN